MGAPLPKSWLSPPVTQSALTLAPSDLERDQQWMQPHTLRDAAHIFNQHGVVKIKHALPPSLLEPIAKLVDKNFEHYMALLRNRKIDPQAQPFAFREICHRAPRRYDVQLGEIARYPLPEDLGDALSHALWQPLLKRLLGGTMNHNFDGVVVAEPGAAAQEPHMDGGHLFHATHGFSLDLPVHMVNVFIPLIDVPLEVGPTEFWPQSHRAQYVDSVEEIESVALTAQRGDAIIFDYRIFHRGCPNLSTERRPVLYQTYSRSWCKDGHNFPKVSIEDVMTTGDLTTFNPSTGFH